MSIHDEQALPVMVAMFSMSSHIHTVNTWDNPHGLDLHYFPCPKIECEWHIVAHGALDEHLYYHYVVPPVIEHLEEEHPEWYESLRTHAITARGEVEIREANRDREQLLVCCPSITCLWYRVVDNPWSDEEESRINAMVDSHVMDHFLA